MPLRWMLNWCPGPGNFFYLWAADTKRDRGYILNCVFPYGNVCLFKVKTFLVIVWGKGSYEYKLITSATLQGCILKYLLSWGACLRLSLLTWLWWPPCVFILASLSYYPGRVHCLFVFFWTTAFRHWLSYLKILKQMKWPMRRTRYRYSKYCTDVD